MNATNYPLKEKDYSLERHIMDTLGTQNGLPALASERDVHEQIRASWGRFAHAPRPRTNDNTRQTFRGEHDRVAYLPLKSFGVVRADLGGGTFQAVSGMKPVYTTGLINYNKVFKAGATALEGCEGQVVLTGTTALPAATFSATTGGTTQTLTGTVTVNSAVVTGLSSTGTLAAGMSVSGTGIQSNTVIKSVDSGTQVTLTVPAIASGTPSLTFYAIVDGVTAANNSPPVFVGGNVSGNSMVFQPLRLSFRFNASKQLLAQSPDVFVPVLREQIARGVSSALDTWALFGTGPANGQPLGIFSSVTAVNLGASPLTWSNYKGYQQSILQTNLDPETYGLIVSPSMMAYLDSTLAYAGGSYSIWEKMLDNHPDRCFVGNEINTSTAMASGKGIFIGIWATLHVMIFTPGIEVVFDPVTLVDYNQTVIRANVLANVGLTFPNAFAAAYQN